MAAAETGLAGYTSDVGAQAAARLIEARELGFTYPQGGRLPGGLNLQLASGEAVLLTGPSGSGKSTIARCLGGLIPHLYHGQLEGAVWLNGLRTSDHPLWRLSREAGFVFQNPASQMLAHSVDDELAIGLENLGLTADETERRVQQYLADFGLERLRHRAPRTLSGGEQQKLALAAMMARQPPVLILDEPLSMLDSTAAMDLVTQLRQLVASGTVVAVCEHRDQYFGQFDALRVLRLGSRSGGGAGAAPLEWRKPADAPLRLEVERLSVALGGRRILEDLSFDLRGGQFVAVVGRNGVGKTTLLRALAGLQRHDGAVSLAGERPDFGLVFQNADLQLFNGSVREEILHRLPGHDEALYRNLLAALGLSSYEDTPPLLLSEGEKKRVALATVLMRQPRHGLLLDEPSQGQDGAHKEMLLRICRSLAASGRIVLLTTHDLPLAAAADRLLVLGRDGIVADGPPRRLLRDPQPWRKIGLQVPDWVVAELPPEPLQAEPMELPQRQRELPHAGAEQAGQQPGAPEAGRRRQRGGGRRSLQVQLVEESPFRQVDPRVKMLLVLFSSLAVMLDLYPLLVFGAMYTGLLAWARLLPQVLAQLWRLKWVLCFLFVVDWFIISPEHAWLVTLRVVLLASVFALLFYTTAPVELRQALEWLRLPHRYAFSLSLAFESIGMIEEQWRNVFEAQRSRGAWPKASWEWRQLGARVRDMVSLAVPAVVMVARFAWASTEAAYARGFDSPQRRPRLQLRLGRLDWLLLLSAGLVLALVLTWRFGVVR